MTYVGGNHSLSQMPFVGNESFQLLRFLPNKLCEGKLEETATKNSLTAIVRKRDHRCEENDDWWNVLQYNRGRARYPNGYYPGPLGSMPGIIGAAK